MSDNFGCVVCCFGGDHKGFLTKSNLNFTGVWCKNGYTQNKVDEPCNSVSWWESFRVCCTFFMQMCHYCIHCSANVFMQ